MARKRKKKKTKKTANKRKSPAQRRKPARQAAAKSANQAERDLEEGLRETFPGSDPLAITDPTRSIKE
jgi:hypothetical protein